MKKMKKFQSNLNNMEPLEEKTINKQIELKTKDQLGKRVIKMEYWLSLNNRDISGEVKKEMSKVIKFIINLKTKIWQKTSSKEEKLAKTTLLLKNKFLKAARTILKQAKTNTSYQWLKALELLITKLDKQTYWITIENY